jgi:nucleoside-diphosphate-sugar epimerase
MKKNTIVITGVNGFIGANIAIHFLANGYKVIGLVRSTSNLSRCAAFKENAGFTLLHYDDVSLAEQLKAQTDLVLIHTAWQGVTAQERMDWSIQFKNLELGFKLLQLAKECSFTTVIGLGSQAEYGSFEGRVDENYPCNPNTAYGLNKHMLSQLWSRFCEENNMQWYWLRLFSVYGLLEDEHWFITNLITKLQKNEDIALTAGEQQYDYLFVEDLAKNIEALINANADGTSGVYNLSANQSIQLKAVAGIVKELIPSTGELLFGKIPYRENQIMHMEGNSEKFKTQFGLTAENMQLNISKMINKK